MARKNAQPEMFDDEPGFGSGLLGLAGQTIAAHPSLAGGTAAFLVIFGFVASNALWNQPGAHPAPILKTREIVQPANATETGAQDAGALTPEAIRSAAETGTTYRIERRDTTPTASIPVPEARKPVPGGAVAVAPAIPQAQGDAVLARIQEILTSTGHYSGAIDGLIGPKSRAAIGAWQKQAGLNPTGEPSAALLKIMEGGNAAPAATRSADSPAPSAQAAPVPAPRPQKTARPAEVAAIAPAQDARPPVTEPAPAARTDDLVRRIQEGLSNIAYADITVDGVAGSQTRAAIEAFEKHYRLPVTGEPNQQVLKKLMEIGAL